MTSSNPINSLTQFKYIELGGSLKRLNWNISACILLAFASGVTASLINKMGHAVFNCERDTSRTSNFITYVSIVAGSITGIYAKKFLPLHVLTAKATVPIFCMVVSIAIIVNIASRVFGNKPLTTTLLTAGILTPLITLGGPHSAELFLAVGAYIGAHSDTLSRSILTRYLDRLNHF
jgi:hypothetical protein